MPYWAVPQYKFPTEWFAWYPVYCIDIHRWKFREDVWYVWLGREDYEYYTSQGSAYQHLREDKKKI